MSELKTPAEEPRLAEQDVEAVSTDRLREPRLYINRELSQLEFNRRVLDEALKSEHPLLERVKFVAIVSSNLDEFFMVRVSGLKQQVLLGIIDAPADGLSPREQLVAIHQVATELLEREMDVWNSQLQPALAEAGIHVLDYAALKKRQVRNLRQYFDEEIFPVLTPLAFDPGHPFPHISNLSVNLAVVIRDPDSGTTRFARVKVPNTLSRLVPLNPLDPDELLPPKVQKFVWVEQIIAANLDRLFPGMEIVTSHPFRVTRNNDMEIQEEEADDLLLTMEENLRQRHFGRPVRLEIDGSMPDWIRDILISNLQIGSYDTYRVSGPLGLGSLWELVRLERPSLRDTPFQPVVPPALRSYEDIFLALRQQNIFLHHPYDSFGPVVDLVETAAEDPDVLAIKQTLYRVGTKPAMVHALTKARANGKQVSVLVELKARFDEESNIEWARALERSGVHVVYGLIGLKTHCKLTLIVRRERDGLRRYVHMATGNYNTTTARLYSDFGYLTSDEAIGADTSEVFNYLTGYSKQETYRRFLVAPVNMRQQLMRYIEQETSLGPEGYIYIKGNSLVDPEMIRAFYRAAQAGVRIDLLIRGICCLRPGLPGISETIRVKSIVGRFLEHSRAYYFGNGGDPLLYLGSADLMPRNLDRRVEILFPVTDPQLRQHIYQNILQAAWRDTAKAYELGSDGRYRLVHDPAANGGPPFNSQQWFMEKRSGDAAAVTL